MNNISRRAMLTGVAASFAAFGLPGIARALTPASASTLVTSVVDDINSIINSGRSEAAILRDFERIFLTYGDVNTIARYALGADGRSASRAQMAAFTDAFTHYISRKYGRRFREFEGGRIEVNAAREVKNFYEVRTTARLRGEAPFSVVFLVSDRSGQGKFFNIFIEGINMLASERTEIGAMLDRRRGNLDALIQDLKRA
ncbi:ABC transporter substrate-binding protein [Sulfitobacter sp. 1151]|uniref:ABC transporter substrate-binding protein n=2 Tax=Parasulfitobacter algicola TaxID=2614809 RepID=A0ABX2IWG6_9RHOB|nr:ABC transporter substrate-binding protein [Sulfitobacter algicola]